MKRLKHSGKCSYILFILGILFAYTQIEATDYYIDLKNGSEKENSRSASTTPSVKNFEVDSITS